MVAISPNRIERHIFGFAIVNRSAGSAGPCLSQTTALGQETWSDRIKLREIAIDPFPKTTIMVIIERIHWPAMAVSRIPAIP